MSKIKNGKRFKRLPIKRKKEIERLRQKIDQITQQNNNYILHIAQIQEDLESLICEKNKQLNILNDRLTEKSRLLSAAIGVKVRLGQIIDMQQKQIESILKLLLKSLFNGNI